MRKLDGAENTETNVWLVQITFSSDHQLDVAREETKLKYKTEEVNKFYHDDVALIKYWQFIKAIIILFFNINRNKL